MSDYALTPFAKADVFQIWCYIAGQSEEAANRVEQAIYDACAFIADAPSHGHARSQVTSRRLLFWALTRYPNYTVVYRPETDPLQVVAVLKRNIRGLLRQRSGPQA